MEQAVLGGLLAPTFNLADTCQAKIERGIRSSKACALSVIGNSGVALDQALLRGHCGYLFTQGFLQYFAHTAAR